MSLKATQFGSLEVAILILDKLVFRAKKIIRDIEIYYMNKKGSVLQNDILILNGLCVRQKLIELCNNIDKSTIIVGDINVPYQYLTDPGGRKSMRIPLTEQHCLSSGCI